jgi:prevent-host-death family protein
MTDNRRSEPSSNVWTLADAQARFSEIIDRAQTRPQVISRHGLPSAVLVSAEEWARRTARKGTLADFLLASPLREAPMDIERVRDRPRDIEL